MSRYALDLDRKKLRAFEKVWLMKIIKQVFMSPKNHNHKNTTPNHKQQRRGGVEWSIFYSNNCGLRCIKKVVKMNK